METLKYTIIKSEEQYTNYCDALENLLVKDDSKYMDEIELLTLLIEKWDNENNSFNDLNPIELIKSLMHENNLKAADLTQILGLSKGTVSKILNYHKGLSKDTIRKLSEHFKVSQEAFNRPYKLKNEVNRHYRNASLMNTQKDLGQCPFS
jgi:HTH-type transcriptional regulator/antitoxin HigA